MSNNQNPKEQQNIKLNLELDETNLILEALGRLPFINVHELISKIQQQASTQLNSQKEQP